MLIWPRSNFRGSNSNCSNKRSSGFPARASTTLFVREELLKMRGQGAAIFLVSNDLTEILTLSDKIAVIYKGEIVGIVDSKNANRENIGLLMGGRKQKKEIDNN